MKKFRVVSLLFSLAVIYIFLTGHSNGQASGSNEDDTGSPTSKLCSSCHSGGVYAPVTTSIQVFTHGTTTAIASYTPATLYDVRVTVTPGAGTPKGYGFEFTGLTTPGNVPLSGYSNLATNVKQKTLTTGTWSGRTFTEHNGVSTSNVFNFSWTAPATGTGTIEFYADGNAVNGDGKSGGDNPSPTTLTLPEIIGVTGTTTNVLCFGASTGAITLTTVGGTSPYTYNWGNNITSQNRTALAAGSYTVTVTDHASATSTQSFTITQPSAALSIAASTTNVLCFGNNTGAINITVSGGTSGYAYNWGSGITSQNRTSITAGNYSLTVTDNNSCTATHSYTITQPAAQLAVAGTITNVLCFGGSTGAITINPTGGTSPYTYNWGGSIKTQDRTSVVSGAYQVTVTDTNGCTATNSFTITQPPVPLTVTGTITNVSCFGGNNGAITSNVSNGTQPLTYNWGGGIKTPDRDSLISGAYPVTVTDSNGCTATNSFTIAQPQAALSLSATTVNVLCFGGNNGSIQLTPTGGTTPYLYNWGGSIASENRSSLTSGNYSVTVDDKNGCKDSASFSISQPAKLIAADTAGTITCFGATTTVAISATGGVKPYTGTGSFIVPAGNYTYPVTDANGCPASANPVITQPAKLIATASTVSISCNGDSGTITVNATGGTPPYSDTGNFTVFNPGSFTYTVTDSNGCSANATGMAISASGLTDSFTVTAPACHGSCNGSILVLVSGGTQPYSFVWSDSTSGQNDTGLCAGNYLQKITDSTGCSLINNYSVPDVAALEINLTADSIFCFGDSSQISVNVSGGAEPYRYQWSGGQAQGDIRVPAGAYTLGVTDNHNCRAADSLSISQPEKLLVTGDVAGAACFGYNTGSINLTVTGGIPPYSFGWSNDSTTMDLAKLTAGEYAVIVTDSNSCMANSTFNVTQPDSITIALVSVTDNAGNSGGVITVSASGGTPPYQYNWDNSDTGSTISNLGQGIYAVTVADSNGCTQSLKNIAIIATGTTNLLMNEIMLYPNPVTDKLFVHLPELNILVQVRILSVEGTVVGNMSVAGRDNWLDVSGLPPALYVVEIRTGEEKVKFKVMKME